MTTKSMAYDNPTYVTRQGIALGEAGGAATTDYAKFVAFTGMIGYSAQLTVTVAGTATSHGFDVLKISGTATTTLGSAILGTDAAGTTINVPLVATTGGVPLLQGDILTLASLADATGKAAVAYEVGAAPLSSITA